MTPNAVGVTTSGSTASPAGASTSPIVAGPESAPVSADFLALLLLTLGLDSGTSQSEAGTTDAAPGDDSEAPAPAAAADLTALAATAPIAVSATMSMTTPLPISVAVPADGSSPQSARTIDGKATIDRSATIEVGATIAAATTPTAIGRPDTTSSPRAAASGGATAPGDTPVGASEAHHALAELGSEKIDPVADAKAPARPEIADSAAAASPAPAPPPPPLIETNARPTVSADDPREHEREAAAVASTTPKTHPVTAPTRPEPVASIKPETAERHQAPEPRPSMPQHGADIVALGAHTEAPARAVTSEAALGASAASPAPAVEPRIITDQVVRAARLVVDDGLAQMRVDLAPPVLGAVRVQADVRGEVVMLTITAERPETQALLTQALPDIQQALVRRDVGPTWVAIIGSTATPLSSDGRRAPDRRPETPRERPTPQPGERRRALHASRGVSALDITV